MRPILLTVQVEKYANINILSFKKWKFDVFFSDPINTFSCSYKTDNEPIRISYHRNTHYNSIVDPCKATIGVGLGLPGLQPGVSWQLDGVTVALPHMWHNNLLQLTPGWRPGNPRPTPMVALYGSTIEL
jgi:hypothetical protein